MKRLLIRADDLGFSEAINYGIEKSVKEGLIRSVGIMTNMPSAAHGVSLLEGCDVCYGQHTNICADRPLTDPALIPSLVQENGEFKPSKEYRAAFSQGIDFVDLDEVILEIEAQYERFKELTGREPEYFEGHAVASANFFRGLQIVADRHHLEYAELTADVAHFRNSDFRIHLGSMKPGYDPRTFMKEVVDNADDEVVDVFVCHPGYLDSYILTHSSLTMPRAFEVEMLCDREIKKYIEVHQIRLVTYNDL